MNALSTRLDEFDVIIPPLGECRECCALYDVADVDSLPHMGMVMAHLDQAHRVSRPAK